MLRIDGHECTGRPDSRRDARGAALLVYLLSRKGLGGGDVKFLAAAGLYLTVGPGLTAVILGTLLSALTALVLMALRKLSVKDAIPLIPFLYVGILVVLFLS